MSVEPTDDSSEVYCTPSDVADYFQKYEDFTEDTNPSEQLVERRIQAKSDWIDSYTGHAWRERRVVNEHKNLEGPYRWRSGMPIKLMHRDIRTPLDPEKGDSLEFWKGNEYEDWASEDSYEQGRGGDFWFERSTGMLHVYRRAVFWRRYREMRISYRYGKEKVPPQIRDACAKLVTADLMRTQQYRITTPGNEEAPDEMSVAERWEEEVKEELQRYSEVRSIGGQ